VPWARVLRRISSISFVKEEVEGKEFESWLEGGEKRLGDFESQ
jgi:hypothetical protein